MAGNSDPTAMKIPLSFASCSVGTQDDSLPEKLDAIANAGFQAIELAMPDLVSFANLHLRPHQPADGKDKITAYDYDELCAAARTVKTMCDAKSLQILILQPFTNFEGWPEESTERKDAWNRVSGWMRIMDAVGTDLLQVGSSDSPEEKIGNDRGRFVKDLQELADMLATKKFRVAYENWCWSTHAAFWEDVWDICKQVDRPNFGLCLDTFQSAGGECADPSTTSGWIEDGRTQEQVEGDWAASCERLAKTIASDKIYLLQISDAYKPVTPLSKHPDEAGMPSRARWSHDFRPLPFDGYLPVVDFTRAVLRTGFRGWFSYEIFDGGPAGNYHGQNMHDNLKIAIARQERLLAACVEQEIRSVDTAIMSMDDVF